MITKAEISALQTLGGMNLISDLLSKYPMQVFESLAKWDAGDLGLPAKLVQEFLFHPPKHSVRFSHSATLLPSIDNLPLEVVKLIQEVETKEGDPNLHQHQEPSQKEERPQQTAASLTLPKEKGKSEEPMKMVVNPHHGQEGRGETPNSVAGTVKDVLVLLYALSKHLDLSKPEDLKIFKLLIERFEGKISSKEATEPQVTPGTKNIERSKDLPFSQSTAVAKPEKLDVSKDLPLREEKPLTEKLDPVTKDLLRQENRSEATPKGSNLPERDLPKQEKGRGDAPIKPFEPPAPKNYPAESRSLPHPEAAKSPSTLQGTKPLLHQSHFMPKESSQPVPLAPAPNTSIPAAPFSMQFPISTAPRKEKKKKDPWEREEEEEEEDLNDY